MITHDHEYLTVREAAELLRVSVPTIRRWIASGRLPADRPGVRSLRVRRSSLKRLNGETGGRQSPHTQAPVDSQNERIANMEQVLADIETVNRAILARRGGKPLPSSVPLIRQARRERARHL
jgi:excisionase family DNA binding protein